MKSEYSITVSSSIQYEYKISATTNVPILANYIHLVCSFEYHPLWSLTQTHAFPATIIHHKRSIIPVTRSYKIGVLCLAMFDNCLSFVSFVGPIKRKKNTHAVSPLHCIQACNLGLHMGLPSRLELSRVLLTFRPMFNRACYMNTGLRAMRYKNKRPATKWTDPFTEEKKRPPQFSNTVSMHSFFVDSHSRTWYFALFDTLMSV